MPGGVASEQDLEVHPARGASLLEIDFDQRPAPLCASAHQIVVVTSNRLTPYSNLGVTHLIIEMQPTKHVTCPIEHTRSSSLEGWGLWLAPKFTGLGVQILLAPATRPVFAQLGSLQRLL
jgi:hypothetical protein